ncbi:MAG: hypothetical protein WCK77_19620 [Verrucomicrobiota bacterium]
MSALIPSTQTPSDRKNDAGPRMNSSDGKPASVFKFIVTLAIAAAADGLQLLLPPLWIPIDIVAALSFFALWGLRWEIVVVLLPELTPGVEAFPSWVVLAFYLGRNSLAAQPGSQMQHSPIDQTHGK